MVPINFPVLYMEGPRLDWTMICNVDHLEENQGNIGKPRKFQAQNPKINRTLRFFSRFSSRSSLPKTRKSQAPLPAPFPAIAPWAAPFPAPRASARAPPRWAARAAARSGARGPRPGRIWTSSRAPGADVQLMFS